MGIYVPETDLSPVAIPCLFALVAVLGDRAQSQEDSAPRSALSEAEVTAAGASFGPITGLPIHYGNPPWLSRHFLFPLTLVQ